VSSRGSSPTRLSRPLLLTALAALVAVVVFGAGRQGGATAALGDCTPGAGWGTVRSDLATQVVASVNQHRAGLGLAGLAESATLKAAAVWKARHMAAYGYMGHDDPAPPVARTAGDRVAACGYTSGWGENVAYGYSSTAAVMEGWLSSPGHKANIERSSFRAIGVGVAAAANGTLYWTQVFGTVADTGSPPPPAPSPPPVTPPPAPGPPTPAPRTPAPAPKPTTAATKPPAAAPKPAAPAPKPQGPPGGAPAPAAPAPASPTKAAQRTPQQLEASRLLEWGSRPRAGRTFTGRLTISRPSTDQRVDAGRATCRAQTAGRRVWVGIHRFRNGFVVCSWHVPRIAKGHRLIGTIRVSVGNKRTARWFSRIVR
jgi:uncharacterized protein YkwD